MQCIVIDRLHRENTIFFYDNFANCQIFEIITDNQRTDGILEIFKHLFVLSKFKR